MRGVVLVLTSESNLLHYVEINYTREYLTCATKDDTSGGIMDKEVSVGSLYQKFRPL